MGTSVTDAAPVGAELVPSHSAHLAERETARPIVLSDHMPPEQAAKIEAVLMMGNLAPLNAEQRVAYHNAVCKSVGLNPLTMPFAYLALNGKTVLYAQKGCTDQLRSIHRTSVSIVSREVVEGCYVVTARATTPSGRTDEAIGVVPISNLQGEARGNAMMKAETKAKRRVTLSIHGLGFLDESEIDDARVAESDEHRRTSPPETGAKISNAARLLMEGRGMSVPEQATAQAPVRTPAETPEETPAETPVPSLDDVVADPVETPRTRAENWDRLAAMHAKAKKGDAFVRALAAKLREFKRQKPVDLTDDELDQAVRACEQATTPTPKN